MTLLYPSIDLRDGKVVRLRRGDYAHQSTYDVDPVAVAERFCADGATWIHVVDLDAARTGERTQTLVIAAIAAAVSGRAAVQAGGGVRRLDDAAALVDAGAARVVVGSATVAGPGFVGALAERTPVAVALDHRAGMIATDGWTVDSDLSLDDGLARFPEAAAFVITDISRDGMLGGPDVEGIARAVVATTTPVIASGGVGSLADIAALNTIEGLHGIITGRALYEGRFTVAEAVAALA
jgi:phosphoribosylformimino-5-aminoimidazole carboxamide ribotide isomerase